MVYRKVKCLYSQTSLSVQRVPLKYHTHTMKEKSSLSSSDVELDTVGLGARRERAISLLQGIVTENISLPIYDSNR